MIASQLVFGELFSGFTFGPRNEFEPREWQLESLDEYMKSLERWKDLQATNGAACQHVFTIFAGTGSGKTKASALLAAYALNTKLVRQVIIVVPNRAIRTKTRRDFHKFFGIDIRQFHKRKFGDGVGGFIQGYILTYGHLIEDPTLHRRICASAPTLVILDEVHHLGERGTWGASAEEAFALAPYVVALTGTPYRTGNEMIPFVTYEETGQTGLVRFKAAPPTGYTYTLGRAIADGVCRYPLFVFHHATVRLRTDPNAGETVVTFDDTKVNEVVSQLRLRGAVTFGSSDRKAMLEAALRRCRDEGRKVIIFLGGDTESDDPPKMDAVEFLPSELTELGYGPDDFDVVIGEDPKAQATIEAFGASSKWILVSINMVSEGVDIPEVSAAVFLTTISAKQTTVQRIGRTLRMIAREDPRYEKHPHPDALIFMFAHPEYVALDEDIRNEITQEINVLKQRRQTDPSAGGQGEERRYRAEAIGVGDGQVRLVKFNGREWPAETFESARNSLRELGLPATMLETALRLVMEGEHVSC